MQFSVSIALLARTNLNHDIGYLESGLTNSPEMMVLANEVIAMNRRFVEGIRIDSESLAVDVVHQVGPGGEFMSHDHTLEHFREFWTPRIFDRSQLDRWEEQGSKDLNARLREATLALMDQHEVIPLPEAIDQEIDRILSSH
jgi:trimethylamine--corrinoid protein Co-methyltransferase